MDDIAAGSTHSNDSLPRDVEKGVKLEHLELLNTTVKSYAWENVNVIVKDRKTKEPKSILSDVNGIVKAGELVALMGPSGSGKTTLLNVLAHREAAAKAQVKGSLTVNGTKPSIRAMRRISAYVEQEDALIGSLTVEDTLAFAAKLSLPSSVTKADRQHRIHALLTAFGLVKQAQTIIGTPIRKGISGGQKRRVSVASQLITSPKLLFLDEPTSGLDSAASYEVISFVRNIAKQNNLIVIASIHQPSTSTFELFDKLVLLSHGKTAYNGPVAGVRSYFESAGFPMPLYMNPAEFIIDLVNTDFARDAASAEARLQKIQTSWSESAGATHTVTEIAHQAEASGDDTDSFNNVQALPEANKAMIPVTLIHRSLVKAYRDVIAYGVRIIMYLGLAIMMGTVWLRLSSKQENIPAFINFIFFSGAFMSFMAVAYIPSYLEDRSLYIKERANGLYGPLAFMLANFLVGVPFLFLIALLFSVVAYWLSAFRASAEGFWVFVMYLFLDLLAAESLVVLLSSLFPIFVVSLAATAFANGLWMSVMGFMVQPQRLNVFWRYVFHYIDYQAYVFQGMMVNEFNGRVYDCTRTSDGCSCMYPSPLASECKLDGRAVLDFYGYPTGRTGKWVGILLAIVAGYRALGLLVLWMKRT